MYGDLYYVLISIRIILNLFGNLISDDYQLSDIETVTAITFS